jgi:hypothetical protein
MKKIILLSLLSVALFIGCKKKDKVGSMVVTASFPTVSITGSQYYSIPVGGTFPTINATAYDSFYKQSYATVIDQSTVNNNVPGLYAVSVSAKNQYGYVGYTTVFVAVTNVSDSLNLAGFYLRGANPAFVTKLARGLFMTSNVGGDDTATQASSVIPAVFAVTSDSTIDFGSQLTSAGTLTASQETLSLAVGDTTLNYAVNLTGFGTQVRTFVKQ